MLEFSHHQNHQGPQSPHLRFAALQMDDEQHAAEQETDATDHDVGEAEERVLATQNRGRRQDELLRALELNHRVR